jgi:hypothetical protein
MYLDYIRKAHHGEGSVGEFPSPTPDKSADRKAVRSLRLELPSPINDKLRCGNETQSSAVFATNAKQMWNLSGQQKPEDYS